MLLLVIGNIISCPSQDIIFLPHCVYIEIMIIQPPDSGYVVVPPSKTHVTSYSLIVVILGTPPPRSVNFVAATAKTLTGANGQLSLLLSVLPHCSVQWGFDGQHSDNTGNILTYDITIPLSCNTVYSYATGSSGDDLTNIKSIEGTTMRVSTCKSLQTDVANKVKRPFHYIILCKQ